MLYLIRLVGVIPKCGIKQRPYNIEMLSLLSQFKLHILNV